MRTVRFAVPVAGENKPTEWRIHEHLYYIEGGKEEAVKESSTVAYSLGFFLFLFFTTHQSVTGPPGWMCDHTMGRRAVPAQLPCLPIKNKAGKNQVL